MHLLKKKSKRIQNRKKSKQYPADYASISRATPNEKVLQKLKEYGKNVNRASERNEVDMESESAFEEEKKSPSKMSRSD